MLQDVLWKKARKAGDATAHRRRDPRTLPRQRAALSMTLRFNHSSLQYSACRNEQNEVLRAKIKELAITRVRYGYRRLLGAAPARGLEGQREARTPALSPGRQEKKKKRDKTAAAQPPFAYASRQPDRTPVEHGLHARSLDGRSSTAFPASHRRRHRDAQMSDSKWRPVSARHALSRSSPASWSGVALLSRFAAIKARNSPRRRLINGPTRITSSSISRAQASPRTMRSSSRLTRAFAKSCSIPGGLLISKKPVKPRGRGGGSTTKIDRTDHCPTKPRKPLRHGQEAKASKNHTRRWPSVWGTSSGFKPPNPHSFQQRNKCPEVTPKILNTTYAGIGQMRSPDFLKQYGELTQRDFQLHPVWINVHGIDQDEPWYENEEIDEETFRPYTGDLPVSTTDGILLVAATLQLADGTEYPGFLTPIEPMPEASPLDRMRASQPSLFARSGVAIDFWTGIYDPRDDLARYYQLLDHPPAAVFPIVYRSRPGLCEKSVLSGEIPGFCWFEYGEVWNILYISSFSAR